MNDERLENLVRQLVANYEAPVDFDGWQHISRRLHRRRRRKAVTAWLYVA
jgi:hypothetical protein